MKKFTPLFSILLLSVLFLPTLVSAVDVFPNLIVCNGPDCHFKDLMKLVVTGINALVIIATILTAVALIFMGLQLIMSAGNAAALTKVKGQAFAILKGFFWILAAWLIVYTIMKVLVEDKYILLGNPGA